MNKSSRIYSFDVLRAISTIAIIAIHVSDGVFLGTGDFSFQWWYGIIIQGVVRIALPIFFMLSGALILNGKDEDIISFYKKRVIRVIVPLFVYSAIYLIVYNYKWSIFYNYNIIKSVLDIIKGPVFYHLWFVYSIIGIYIVAPFIKIMIKNLSDRLLTFLILTIIIIRIGQTYLPIFDLYLGINNIIFDNWILYFILGYFLSKKYVIEKRKFIYLLGIISYIMTIIILRFIPKANSNIYDFAPTMICMSSAVFLLFNNTIKCVKENRYIKLISKYSYSIYLIHAFVLAYIVSDKLGIGALTINPVIGVIITVSITLIISIFIVLIIDNTIIKLLYKFLSKY
ncbi:acyltransferase [Clostridium tertium]|jgi:surface polysaccharide O-acyltransferase-like enzyme|uniref:acyltransferase n=1 Tax=Clostridium tertium TaxID=1559 RepID=UPI000BE28456|nr:acyltransferase family protein [Clostridium tertium]